MTTQTHPGQIVADDVQQISRDNPKGIQSLVVTRESIPPVEAQLEVPGGEAISRVFSCEMEVFGVYYRLSAVCTLTSLVDCLLSVYLQNLWIVCTSSVYLHDLLIVIYCMHTYRTCGVSVYLMKTYMTCGLSVCCMHT